MRKNVTILEPPLPLVTAALTGITAAIVTMLSWRSEKAKSLYLSQCDVALRYPRFSNPDLAKLDLEARTFDGSAEDFECYEWYVARLVYVLDECVRLCPVPQWYAVARTQLGNHRKYFASDYYRSQDYLPHYSLRMRTLIRQRQESA
ncbi:MAG TPA: hypothetical protein VL286_06175 [Rhizomicrobium sp.]|jgi:hypothetical protein|nr:hypothetical protein [Rhizomicrobium sp.]